MTYCVAALLDSGMVFASDSCTDAGFDQIATFRKMHVIAVGGERLIVVLSSGNLSITQRVINLLDYQTRGSNVDKTVHNASSMLEIANLVGDALREVHRRDGPYLQQSNIDSNASFIVGGQIRNEPQRLFNIYSEGNFIEATPETPYFQIGESKYAKPMLDRVINRGTHLLEAAKCVLVSFDSTMRSNISVGLPIDVVIYDNNSLKMRAQRVIYESDAYFKMIHTEWGEGLRRVFAQLPNPDWIRDSISDAD
jgi:putative proteasome-type protease